MAVLNFNASEVDPAVGFEPIPPGEYTCAIVASEMKPTRRGDGSYLQLQLEVLDGQYKGRRLWDRLNLENKNPTTVRIARATLSSICRSTRVMCPKDSTELHAIPLVVSVKVKQGDDGTAYNEVRGYSARAQAPAVAAPPSDQPPWKR